MEERERVTRASIPSTAIKMDENRKKALLQEERKMEELNVWASSQQKFFRRSKTETGEGGCTICLQNKNILCNVHMKYAKRRRG